MSYTVVHNLNDNTQLHINEDGSVVIQKSDGHFTTTSRAQDDGSGFHIPKSIQELQAQNPSADIVGVYTRHHNLMTNAQMARAERSSEFVDKNPELFSFGDASLSGMG